MAEATLAGQVTGWPDGWLLPLLQHEGLLTDLDLPRLRETGAPTAWAACIAAGLASDEWILSAISRRFRLLLGDVDAVPRGVAALLPGDLARRLQVVPLALRSQILEVACANPTDVDLERAVAFGAGHRVRLFLAAPTAIGRALDRLYPPVRPVEVDVQRMVDGVDCLPGEGLSRELEEIVGHALDLETSIPELVDALIVRGIRLGASDLHLEPTIHALVARYRVDGILHEISRMPRSVMAPLVSRLKVMANLDIADRLRPQDGRAQAVANGRRVDLRVSSLPVSGLGEKIVVRILDSGAATADLDRLGFDAGELNTLKDLLHGRDGLVLVTGPTGSGKTTTLYAALRSLQSSEVNIVTVEDPIEYRLEGISQVQINEKAGLTFATTLRSILRQDPDVVLVGEIRDQETADVAIQAALTGHLVLSTLHTTDAPTTIMRLVDMGVDVSSLAAALRGVVAQRLIRRVCMACRREISTADLPATQQALLAGSAVDRLYTAVGCPECHGTGYRGRLAVGEIVAIDAQVQRTIAHGGQIDDVERSCRCAGMHTTWDSGLRRVLQGVTTLHELLDNVAPPSMPAVQKPGSAAGGAGVMAQDDIDELVNRVLAERAAAAASPAPAASRAGDAAAGNAVEAAPGRDERVPTTADAGAPRIGAAPVGPARPRVLIADEDAEARRRLREGLVAEGMRVLEASDGETALEYIRRMRPDAVVMELALPRVDGFGILRAVRDGQVPAARCVVLTVQDDPDVAAWATELGAVDYLVKPVTPRVLAARLQTRITEAA